MSRVVHVYVRARACALLMCTWWPSTLSASKSCSPHLWDEKYMAASREAVCGRSIAPLECAE